MIRISFVFTLSFFLVGCAEHEPQSASPPEDLGDDTAVGELSADDTGLEEPSGVIACPGDEDMILIRAEEVFTGYDSEVATGEIGFPDHDYCIDRYEASRGPGGVAESVRGVLPWVEATWADADGACRAAGKRLCTPQEWVAACHGPTGGLYPYGDEYSPGVCNGRNEEEDTDGVLAATGSHPECEGGFAGLFDMSGNAHELTWRGGPSTEIPGGSFYDGRGGLECEAAFDQDLGSPGYETMGFRCCMDVE